MLFLIWSSTVDEQNVVNRYPIKHIEKITRQTERAAESVCRS